MLDSIRDMIPWLKFGVEVARAFVTWIGDNFARGWAMAYDAIKAIGGAIAEALDLQRIQGWVGEWIPSWQQIKDTMLHGMAVVIVAFQQWDMTRDIIMNQAKQGWLSLQATVRDFASSTLNILADWTTSFRDGFIRTLTNGVSVFLGAMSALAGLDPTGALQARVTTAQAAMANLGNIPENAARAMRGLANEIDMGTNEIRDAIRELAENGAADLNDFLGRVARIVDRWRNELAGQVGAAVAQVNALPIASGQIKAITGHEAVTRESEKAFSMLFGNSRGQQDFYARLQAERALNQIEILRDIRGEIRNAPVMRRAAF
jgi:hypothetical protein